MNVQSDCWMQGAKIPNVERNVKIPDWVETMMAKKRKNVVASLQVFIGVMRQMFNVQGPTDWESIVKRFGGDDFNACLVNTI